MTLKWVQGDAQADWIDVCALSVGYALVVVDGLDVVCYTASSATAAPVETWRVTSTMPISFLRCAARTDTDEVRAIGMGTSSTGATTAQFFTSAGQTAKGTAYGIWPVLLQFTGGDWVGYIARTAKTYTRWPFAGAEPAASLNPFTVAGTNLGMIQVVASTVTWREVTPQTAATVGKLKTTTVSGVTLVVPMVISGVTVGQSLGPPTNTTQIIAAHDTTELSTIFPMAGETPHVAVLSDGSFVIVARTAAIEMPRPVPVRSTGYSRAGFAVNLPPWPDYDAAAAAGPNDLYLPWQNAATKGIGAVRGDGRMTEVYEKAFERITDRLATPTDLSSISVTGGGGGSTPVPPPLGQDADVLVGADGTGFPNARVLSNTDTIRWDIGTANVVKARYVGPTIRGPKGDPGPAGPPGPPGSGSGSSLTVAALLALGYWTLVTNGDPVSPELVFDSNGDCIPTFVPTP